MHSQAVVYGCPAESHSTLYSESAPGIAVTRCIGPEQQDCFVQAQQ